MTEQEIRNSIDKTEYEQNGWQIIILESNNQIVKGRYELTIWKNGVNQTTGLSLQTYRKNFIEGLTKVLIDKIIPKSGLNLIEGAEEDFGI
jgi:hypothetical protein